MDIICKAELCTGCAACMNRCPKQCIKMKEDHHMGHLHPVIDHNRCVDCGACQKVCPVNSSLDLQKPLTAYAGWDKCEEEYQSSTSGGAASAFARYIIRQGGVVYGCAILPGIEVKHVRVDNEDDIRLLKGSKYVQSTIGDTYRKVREDLRQDRKVLFIGTPCQVARVKSFIGKQMSCNLYTVDLICHGTPSLSFLRKHILKKTKGVVPDEIFFRKGSCLLLLLLLGGKEIYRSSLLEQRYEDIYYNAFFDGFSYRDSCNECRYAQASRVSDVTIGDFWGLEENLPLEHPHGCSLLLPTTGKGEELVEGIRSEFYLFKRSVREAVNGNDQLRHPKKKNFRIKFFRKILPMLGIANSYRFCMLDKIIRRKLRIIIKGK